MIEYFQAGCKPRSRWRVGAEFEKFAIETATGRQRSYDEPMGIRNVLQGLATHFGWRPIHEGEHLTSLVRDGACVSIEPGAQVELALPPSQSLAEIEQGFQNHLAELNAISGEETTWIAAGVTPATPVEQIPIVPRARYRVMAEYLPTRSPTALHMMKATASTQAAFDFSDETDAMKKFEFALRAAPFVNAICGNSPLLDGKVTGAVSNRIDVWDKMDPARSGMLLELLSGGLSFESWLDYLLDVPMMFVCTNGQYESANGATFRDFMERGHNGRFPSHQDWEIHVTTVFPEARLKRYLEVRGADAANVEVSLGIIAIWKGILHSENSLNEALELVQTIPLYDLPEIRRRIGRDGLQASLNGWKTAELCKQIADLADRGLAEESKNVELDDRRYLEPIRDILDRGQSPGQRFLAEIKSVVDPANVANWFAFAESQTSVAQPMKIPSASASRKEIHDDIMI